MIKIKLRKTWSAPLPSDMEIYPTDLKGMFRRSQALEDRKMMPQGIIRFCSRSAVRLNRAPAAGEHVVFRYSFSPSMH